MKILVTGSAGFIGFHLVNFLINRGDEVIGIDNINDYYDVNLKYGRLEETGIDKSQIIDGILLKSTKFNNYHFIKGDITDMVLLKELFAPNNFDAVCNLAAQAGVRYSLSNPKAYLDSNVVGFLNILECCRKYHIKHLVYASSSSVYGLNEEMPFTTSQNVNHPVSLYAASKKSNELMAHTYSHLFNIPTTGLRIFTVYGPWGRPDMALFIFTKNILENKSIEVYNQGNMKRDFTYIDDIIDGVIRTIDNPAEIDPNWSGLKPDPSTSKVPYKIFNIGRGQSVSLMDFIMEIERNIGFQGRKEFLPLQSGDVLETWADVEEMKKTLGYNPKISVPEGVKKFISWYQTFYSESLNTLSHKKEVVN
jgi:UDP-glucuronate 4-epimerase